MILKKISLHWLCTRNSLFSGPEEKTLHLIQVEKSPKVKSFRIGETKKHGRFKPGTCSPVKKQKAGTNNRTDQAHIRLYQFDHLLRHYEWLILSVSPALLRHGGPLCSVACLSEPDCAVDDHDFQRLHIDDRRLSAVAALLIQMPAGNIFIYKGERFAAVGAFGLALDLHPIELVR